MPTNGNLQPGPLSHPNSRARTSNPPCIIGRAHRRNGTSWYSTSTLSTVLTELRPDTARALPNISSREYVPGLGFQLDGGYSFVVLVQLGVTCRGWWSRSSQKPSEQPPCTFEPASKLAVVVLHQLLRTGPNRPPSPPASIPAVRAHVVPFRRRGFLGGPSPPPPQPLLEPGKVDLSTIVKPRCDRVTSRPGICFCEHDEGPVLGTACAGP